MSAPLDGRGCSVDRVLRRSEWMHCWCGNAESGKRAAGEGALSTGDSAELTVFVSMGAALFCAGGTELCAHGRQSRSEFAAAGCEPSQCSAHDRAFEVDGDAAHHVGGVRLEQTAAEAVIACICTSVASGDAGFVGSFDHQAAPVMSLYRANGNPPSDITSPGASVKPDRASAPGHLRLSQWKE